MYKKITYLISGGVSVGMRKTFNYIFPSNLLEGTFWSNVPLQHNLGIAPTSFLFLQKAENIFVVLQPEIKITAFPPKRTPWN